MTSQPVMALNLASDDISRTLCFLHPPGSVFEVCLIDPVEKKHPAWGNEFARGKKAIVAGWFDDLVKAAEIIHKLDEHVKPSGFYTTLNPCDSALLGRANNRLKASVARTKDNEITTIRHLLIDVDPKRPSGISSTDTEKAAAMDVIECVYSYLKSKGWPEPLRGDSGNGWHLLYKLSLDNTRDNVELVKGILYALDDRFSTDKTDVDTSVYNPSRISKVYGTTARKGDSTNDRPHRRAAISSIPDDPQPVSVELLKELAIKAPAAPVRTPTQPTSGQRLNVEDYLAKYGVLLKTVKNIGSSTFYVLETCVFDESHTGGESAIVQTAEGKLLYQCFHNSCQGRTWHEARAIISGDDRLFPESVTPHTSINAQKSTVIEWPEEDVSLPETAINLIPASMKEIVEIGLKTTHAHADNLILGLLSFIVPIAGAVSICSSEDDHQGERLRLYNLILGPSGVGKTIVITRFVPALLYDLEEETKSLNDLCREQRQSLESELKTLSRNSEDKARRQQIENDLNNLQVSYRTCLLDSATPEGLFKALEHKSTPLVILDEFGATLKRAEKSEHTRGFIDMLTQIADRGSAKGRITKGDDPPVLVPDISLSILATTTTEDLPQKSALSLLRGGHLARYTISYVTEGRLLPDRDYLLESEIRTLRRWRDDIKQAVDQRSGRFVLSSQASSHLQDFKQSISAEFVEAINSGEPDGGSIVRLIRKAKSFSLALHLGDDRSRRNKEISLETMQQACALTTYYHQQHHFSLMTFLNHGEKYSQNLNIGKRILKYLKQVDGRASIREVYKYLHLKKATAMTVLTMLEGQTLVKIEDEKHVCIL